MQPDIRLLVPEKFTVFAARHATPDRSRLDIPYHTPPGPELTSAGEEESAELGAFLCQAGAASFFASPLVRAWRTAQVASQVCGAQLALDVDLAEWRLDEIEKNVVERMGRAFVAAARHSAAIAAPVVIVSHGSPVMTVLKLLQLPPDLIERSRVYDARNLIPMAGAWRIEGRDGQIVMELAHIPQALRERVRAS